MATVDRETAVKVARGDYPEDKATRIVRYRNAWGGESFGVTFGQEPLDKYLHPTEFINDPTIWWDFARDGYIPTV